MPSETRPRPDPRTQSTIWVSQTLDCRPVDQNLLFTMKKNFGPLWDVGLSRFAIAAYWKFWSVLRQEDFQCAAHSNPANENYKAGWNCCVFFVFFVFFVFLLTCLGQMAGPHPRTKKLPSFACPCSFSDTRPFVASNMDYPRYPTHQSETVNVPYLLPCWRPHLASVGAGNQIFRWGLMKIRVAQKAF